jgi:hypothetical protein
VTGSGPQPPVLIGLHLEQACREAWRAGWSVDEIIETAPFARPPGGPPRVIRQRVSKPRGLSVVAAASIELNRTRDQAG